MIVTEKDDKMPKKLTSTSKWHAEAPVCWSKYTTLVNQEISVKIKPIRQLTFLVPVLTFLVPVLTFLVPVAGLVPAVEKCCCKVFYKCFI